MLSCNNTIVLNNDGWVDSNEDVFVLSKKNKPYILKDVLIIPENKTFFVKNGVRLFLKKGGKIINNGNLFLGEKNNIDSVSFFSLKEPFIDSVFYYSVEVFSNSGNLIVCKENSLLSVFNINNVFFKNIKFSGFKKNKIIINNSFFNNCVINTSESNISVFSSFFKNVDINNKNSTVILNNSVFSELKKGIIIDGGGSVINNCLFINSNKNLVFSNTDNNNILNSVFFKNKISISVLKSRDGYYKFFNNIFKENNTVLNSVDSSSFYFINNIFDKNNTVLKYLINKKSTKSIISKNNIFSDNKNNFDLKNIKISNSYCMSNIDSLIGYYNIYSDPFYINSNSFNYNLSESSPALRSGINNLNLGVNISDINIIKYLKY